MTGENVKDLRLLCEMMSKDYKRLGEDMKALSEYLIPVQVSLMLKEEKENVESID